MQRRPQPPGRRLTVWVEDIGRPALVLRWIDEAGHQRQRTAGTANRRQAQRLAAELERELADLASRAVDLAWEAFARLYTRQHAATLDQHTARHWQSVLAKLDDFGPPAMLRDVDARYLGRLAAWMLERGGRSRTSPDGTTTAAPASPATVASYLKRLHHALRWAADKHYLDTAPRIPPPARRARTKKARGRPLALEEFERLLTATRRYPPRTARGLRRILRGLWASGLRLAELLDLHWTRTDHFHVTYLDDPRRAPLIDIPWHKNKSKRAESIPCAPEFAALLRKFPPEARRGRVFRMAGRHGKTVASPDYIQRLIADAGQAAGIIVHRYADGRIKYASAHDLRRTFAQRWADRGLSELELAAIMRHASIETTRQYYLEQSEERLGRRMAALAPQEPPP
jgi:integrase